MNGITHKQAQKYVRLDLDGLLTDDQRRDLETHLSGCEACRLDAQALSQLTSRLQSGFRSRWDAQDGPSKNVMATVRSQTRRIIMSTKVHWGLRTLGGIAVLFILGFGLNIVFSRLRDNSIAANETAIPDNNMPVSARPGDRLIAFTKEADGNLDIYTIRADGTGLTNLTNSPLGEDNPYWSPDGKHIAFNGTIKDRQQIFMMDADGSNAVQLTDNDGMHNKLVSFEEGREAGFDAWSPDGRKLVFVKIDFNLASIGGWMKLYVLDIETKTQTPLTSEWGLYQSPAWSPDGEHVAFTSMTINEQGEPEHISVQVANADGSGLVDLTGSLPDGEFPSMSLSYWSHDGQSVFFISRMITGDSNKVYEARLDGNLIEHAMGTGIQDWWNGTTLLQTNSRLDWLHEDGTQFTLSTCGTRFASRRSSIGDLFFGIYCPGTDWRLYLANEDGSQVNQILEAPITFTGGGLTAAWSPDNQFVAFNLSSQYKTEMYILNMTDALNDPSIRPFSIDVGDVFSFGDSLSWQPVMAEQDQVVEEKPASVGGDRLLAFTKEVDGNFEIFTVRADGTGLTNLTNDPAKDDNPYWSPDGKRIAFNSNRDVNTHNTQVYVMDADGSNVTLLTGGSLSHMLVGFLDGRGDGLGFSPWSPDGSKILLIEKNFSSNTQTLQVLDLATGKQTQLTENSSFTIPSWAPDGQHIAFMTIKDSQSEINHIYVVDLDGNNLVDVTGSLKETEFAGFNYEWSSDGESISFLAGDTANNSDTVYEADLHGVLTEKARSNFKNGLALYWRNGVTMMLTAASSVGWLQSDGTRSELEFCPGEDGRRLNLRESTQGGWIAGMLCPNNEWKVYWANPDGTQTQKILNVSIPAGEDTRFVDLAWSQDDRFVAFNITTGNTAEMYIVDIAETLTDPMVQPEKFDAGKVFDIQGSPVDSLSWQPMPTDRLVELNRTPEPTPTSRNLGLIAFTSAMENDNLDIYTMYPDGSGLTDLTNDPAHDVNPYWSPDGKRIAFMSDRTEFMQVFVMNADGSDVIQLTNNEANHEFGVSDHSPWSPDGSRLLFTEWAASNEKWMLYTVDMNGENKTPIAEVPNVYTSPSWSLDGQHIAYIVTETVEDREVARIHVVGADGTNDTNVTSMLPKDVDLSSWLYSWTPEGNIRFAANRVYVENDSLDFTVYEVTMDGATLAELAHTSTGPGDIWNGTTFVAGTSTLNWLRSDGSYREYQSFEKCQLGSDPQYGSMYKRSSHGYLLFAANCPNGDWWFTWANPQGTQVQQLLDYPISTQQGITHMSWSSDDRYIAINLTSSDVTYLYVINVDAALKDPSTQPVKIPLAGGEQYYNISWQPIP